MDPLQTSFSKWRERLWPIYRFELAKLLPLLFMKFFISLNYGILTSLKDTLVVTADHSGAEIIPILKGGAVLPVAFIMALLYSKLTNHFKRSTLFYAFISFFILFFALYAFYLYPHANTLSPKISSDHLENLLGAKYQHWIAIYRHWMHALFFIFAELWGSLVIFVLFWGYTNDITHMKEAGRFYTLFSAGGTFASIVTGPIVWMVTSRYADLSFVPIQKTLLLLVLLFSLIIIALFIYVEKFVLTKVHEVQKIAKTYTKEIKTKLSLLEGIKFLARSKYIRSLALMVIGYGLTINLIEVTWKAHLKLFYPNPTDYQSFMGTLSFLTGITSFCFALFLGNNVIRIFGWRFSASIPPIMVGLSGIVFLTLCLMKNSLASMPFFLKFSPLAVIVIFGTIQNVLSKSLKYSFFDVTKEIAFIPLDAETKVKGKAAIDVIGSRLGKSGSSWIQLFFIQLTATGSILAVTPYLIPLVAVVTFAWLHGVKKIGEESKNLFVKLEKSSS